tara:strand:- start:553 stop:774 length:222 start_codon:yes stop_codon:yes gene_type:complete
MNNPEAEQLIYLNYDNDNNIIGAGYKITSFHESSTLNKKKNKDKDKDKKNHTRKKRNSHVSNWENLIIPVGLW